MGTAEGPALASVAKDSIRTFQWRRFDVPLTGDRQFLSNSLSAFRTDYRSRLHSPDAFATKLAENFVTRQFLPCVAQHDFITVFDLKAARLSKGETPGLAVSRIRSNRQLEQIAVIPFAVIYLDT